MGKHMTNLAKKTIGTSPGNLWESKSNKIEQKKKTIKCTRKKYCDAINMADHIL